MGWQAIGWGWSGHVNVAVAVGGTPSSVVVAVHVHEVCVPMADAKAQDKGTSKLLSPPATMVWNETGVQALGVAVGQVTSMASQNCVSRLRSLFGRAAASTSTRASPVVAGGGGIVVVGGHGP
jgi:hypothetical protein